MQRDVSSGNERDEGQNENRKQVLFLQQKGTGGMDWSQELTVFLGDSITEGYGVSQGECWVDAMPGRTVNRGISGDTTTGMRRRFAAHVIQAKPARVVIMGGINDLSEGGALETVTDNLAAMYLQAQEAGIEVVPAVCVQPDYDELLCNDWAELLPGLKELPERFCALAEWIRTYARSNHCVCLDFAQIFPKYTQDAYGRYFSDGVHPNARGYALMARIALEILYPEATRCPISG